VDRSVSSCLFGVHMDHKETRANGAVHLIPTCFWHQRLLRSRRAKSVNGMGIRWTAPLARVSLWSMWTPLLACARILLLRRVEGITVDLILCCPSAAGGFIPAAYSLIRRSFISNGCGHDPPLLSAPLKYSDGCRSHRISLSLDSLFNELTSPITYPHLLLASKPAPQATCQKCRRHGD